MRLLIVSDHFPPFIGGAHRWADVLSKGLAERGHTVCVITTWHGGLPRREFLGQVEINRVRQLRTAWPALIRDPKQRHMPPFPDPFAAWDARRAINRFRPDVAIAHGWLSASVTPILARRSVPVLLSTHDYGYFCATRILRNDGGACTGPSPVKCMTCASGFYGTPAMGVLSTLGVALSREVLIRTVAGVHTVSTFVDERTWQSFVRRSERRLLRFIIPSFVDVKHAVNVAAAGARDHVDPRLPDGQFIMFAGALREIKGIGVLLDAYSRLTDPPPLVLMGTIHEDTPVDLPSGAVVIADAPHDLVMEGWRRALVGVVPSVWPDPCPTVAVECASQGTPVIGTVPGGMSDTVGDTGILIPMGDPQALADALAAVIGDDAWRARLGREARARSEQFTTERAFTAYEQALAEIAL